jgi:hypothetical protein
VPGSGELLGARQARGAGADDRDGLARHALRAPQRDEPGFPCPVGNGGLDVLDRHRGLVDGQHAGGLARGGAEPAGELGEVVGGVQPLARSRPVAAPDKIIPFRDEVPERAAVVAEGTPQSMQRPACVLDDRQQASPVVDLVPVLHPLPDRAAGAVSARVLQEALGVWHGALQRQQAT